MTTDRKNPWDEEWTTDAEHGLVYAGREPGLYTKVADFRVPYALDSLRGHEDDELARARLASAAPEMARTLLALEWINEDIYGPFCPSCNAVRYNEWRELSMSDAEMWEHIRRVPGDNDHHADCALDAALRKAGVR
jgi:hypothetical protein